MALCDTDVCMSQLQAHPLQDDAVDNEQRGEGVSEVLQRVGLDGSRLVDLALNPLVFEAGWNGVDWLSFANAAREVLPHLQKEDRLKVEDAVLAHNPEMKWAREILCRITGEGESQPRCHVVSSLMSLNMI